MLVYQIHQRPVEGAEASQTEVSKMSEEVEQVVEKVGWDEAIAGGKFITLEDGEPKELVICNWELIRVTKNFNNKDEEKVEFNADVIEEDGEVVEKSFDTVSNRLKKCLKDVLETLDNTSKVRITVIKLGSGFDTKYSVKLAKKKTAAKVAPVEAKVAPEATQAEAKAAPVAEPEVVEEEVTAKA